MVVVVTRGHEGGARQPRLELEPDGVIGLRHWTVELPSADEVTAVADRVAAAGYRAEPRDDGVLLRDPWDIELLVTSAGGAR